MKTRIELVKNSVDFLDALINIIDASNIYDVENFEKLLKVADNRYLQSLIDFFESYEEYKIKGDHLIELLTIALEGKKELLNILENLE